MKSNNKDQQVNPPRRGVMIIAPGKTRGVKKAFHSKEP